MNKTTTAMKFTKILLHSALLLFLSLPTLAVTWTAKAKLPFGPRTMGTAFTIGTKAYVVTGDYVMGATVDFWEYDPTTDIWTQKADFIGLARYMGASMTIGNKGYVLTGRANIQLSDNWEYNPATNVWTMKANLPGPPRRGAFAFGIGNKGYCGAGVPLTFDFYEYDPTTDVWTRKADFPRPGGWPPLASCATFVLNNKGYVGTGCNSSNNDNWTAQLWEYNPAIDTWTRKADFGGGPRAYAVGFAFPQCNKGYIGTGRDAGSIYADFWRYDQAADTWTQVPTMPANYWRQSAVAIAIGNKAYIGTGRLANGKLTDDWIEFIDDPCTTPCDSNKVTAKYLATTVCLGTATAFSNTSTTSVGKIIAYNYNFGDGSSSTLANPTHTYATAGTFTATLTVTTDSGCVKTTSSSIIINPSPIANAGTNNVICVGKSSTIGTAAIVGNTYQWSSSPAGFNSTLAMPTVSPLVSTTYNLIVSNSSSGCSAQSNVTITLNTAPANSINVPTAICLGKSTSLKSAALPGNTYTWSSSPIGFTSTLANATVSPIINTTYTLIETNTATGCSSTASAMLKVNPSPAGMVGTNTSLCTGQSIAIGAAAVSSSVYYWSSLPAGFTSTLANPTVSPLANTTYTLTETNTTTGCTTTNNLNMAVNPCQNNAIIYTGGEGGGAAMASISPCLPPGLSANFTASDSVICAGTCIQFTDKSTSSLAIKTYTWTFLGANIINDTTQNPSNVCYANAGVYAVSLKIKNTANTEDSIIKTTYITVSPAPAISLMNDTIICQGDSINLQAAATGNNITYTWAPSSSLSSTSIANPLAKPTANSTYTVAASNGLCSSQKSISIKISEPKASLFIEPATGPAPLLVKLMSTSSPAVSYMWSLDTNRHSIQEIHYFDYTKPGTYPISLTITDSIGCKSIAFGEIIATDDSKINIPNAFTPNGDEINDRFNVTFYNVFTNKLKVFNRWGELIYEGDENSQGWDGTYKNAPAEQGVYVYTLEATGIDNTHYNRTGHVTLIR